MRLCALLNSRISHLDAFMRSYTSKIMQTQSIAISYNSLPGLIKDNYYLAPDQAAKVSLITAP